MRVGGEGRGGGGEMGLALRGVPMIPVVEAYLGSPSCIEVYVMEHGHCTVHRLARKPFTYLYRTRSGPDWNQS